MTLVRTIKCVYIFELSVRMYFLIYYFILFQLSATCKGQMIHWDGFENEESVA